MAKYLKLYNDGCNGTRVGEKASQGLPAHHAGKPLASYTGPV
jgi:hypothetical protein